MALSDRELFLRFMEKSLPPSTFPGEGEDHKPIIRHLVPDMQQEAPLLFHGSLPEHINPSGLDLTIGNLIVESDTLITDLTEEEFFQMKPTELEDGEQQVLHPDRNGERIYYISNQERINFPPDLETIVDARSTTGRVGCMCHDVGSLSTGERIIAVQPLAFPLLVTSGLTRLAQAIVRYKETGFLSSDSCLFCFILFFLRM